MCQRKLNLVPEIEASFPGGAIELHRFILEDISYFECQIDPKLGTRFFLSFVVDAEGETINVDVQKAQSPEMTKMEIELVRKMPSWIPAKQLGGNIASRLRLPIIICLE